MPVDACIAPPDPDRALPQTGILYGRGWRPVATPTGPTASAPPPGVAPPSRVAQEGDLVIVQERYDAVRHIVLRRDAVLHNRYGRFAHNDVIGRPLGLRWRASKPAGGARGTNGGACVARGGADGNGRGSSGNGFVFALAPSPALWALAMHHRTQVVYPHDAFVIALHLDLRPGRVVVEAGTGAGAASVAFARAVAPHGRVLSFDFHAERADAAAHDFRALLRISPALLTVRGGHDVVRRGFAGVVADGEADAVFLDLPAPYHVVAEAKRVLRPNGAFCAFSPCVEQVQKTCVELRACGFHTLRTMTAPVRTYETRVASRGAPGFDEVRERIEAGDGRVQSTEARDGQQAGADDEKGGADGKVGEKRKRPTISSVVGERTAVQAAVGAHAGRVLHPTIAVRAKPFADMKGHTSFLTFARRSRDGSSELQRQP